MLDERRTAGEADGLTAGVAGRPTVGLLYSSDDARAVVSTPIRPTAVDAGNSSSELYLGPFCVTRCNPTQQLTDPTRPNPVQLTMELTI